MHKPDFDFKQYVNVPEEWIESALDIPNKVRDAPKVVPIRRYVAAASVVLTVALGVSLFFLFRNKQPIPVAPTAPAVSSEQSSPTTPSSAPSTAQPTDSPSSQTTAPASAPATQLATDADGSVIVITVTTTQASADPTESPVDPTTVPTELPTQEPAVTPTAAPQPTEAIATQPPTVPETFRVSDIKRLTLTLQAMPMSDAEEDDGILYCCIYDSSGVPLGDPDLYSGGHQIDVRTEGWLSDEVVWYYSVDYDAAAVPDNRFTYKIYLRNGTVLKEGTVFE